MATRDIVSSLSVRDFRWLWIGSFGSSFAMNMQITARGWLVYDLTSSAMDLAWVTLSFMLPTVLFALTGGVLADRVPKRRVIAVAQTLNAVATVVMAWIILTGRIEFWDFIWFGFFNGTVLALSMPARQAFVPELVPDRLIFAAMALNTTSWNLTRILGPALAGLLIAWVAAGDTTSTFGVGVVYVMIAVMYAISAVTMMLVRVPGTPHAQAARSPLGDMADAMRYVWAHPPVLALIFLSIVPFLFGMPLNTLLPAFNHDVIAGGPDSLGLLISCMGGGAIVGSLMMATMGGLRRKGLWLVVSCVVWGALTSLFAVTTSFAAAAVVIAAVGWISAWNMSLNRGMLQVQVAPEMRGRILSIDMMSHGLMPLGVIPISFIADRADVATALAASGAAFIVVVVLLWFLSGAVRGLGRTRGEPAAVA